MLPASRTPFGHRLGIDLGGTKIEAALLACERDGTVRVECRERISTPQLKNYDTILRSTQKLIHFAAS